MALCGNLAAARIVEKQNFSNGINIYFETFWPVSCEIFIDQTKLVALSLRKHKLFKENENMMNKFRMGQRRRTERYHNNETTEGPTDHTNQSN